MSLQVNPDGMRSGASNSEGVAADLAARDTESLTGSQPSHGGASAVLAAFQSVSARQSARVDSQAGGLHSGATQYEGTDTHTGSDIAKAM